MTIKLEYTVNNSGISFDFEGNKKEIKRLVRELTQSSIISGYSYSRPTIPIDLAPDKPLIFSIFIHPQAMSDLLWYLRTQHQITITPQEIFDAAKHFKNSTYEKKPLAEALKDAAIIAQEDSSKNQKKLDSYRNKIGELKSKVNTGDKIKDSSLVASVKSLPSYSTVCDKIGFFALGSAATMATTLAISYCTT